MKNVLGYLCGSDSWGGLEMNHVRNAAWMKDRGHSVIYFCIKDSRSHLFAEEMDLQVVFIQKHRKYYDFKRGKELVHLLQKFEITHLLIRSNSDMSILAYAKHKLGSKLQTSYFMEMQMGVQKKNLFHTLRYKYIDLWSCPLNYLAEQVKSMTNYRNRLVIIPSGIDLSRFKPIDRSEARKRMDLPMDRFIFGLAGRFDPQKGQLLLLEAMAKCKNTEFSVVFLGEPTLHEDGTAYYNLMQDTIEKNDLGNRIFIRPFMADIEVFYSAIDWFVMATKAETFGMVTLEALACGTPVLGSNAGGTPELLDHGANGVLFAPMDSTDLSKKIELIMTGNFHFGEEELIQHASHFSAITVCDRIEEELMLSKG